MRGGKFLEIMVCLLGLKKLHMKLCIFVLVCLELSKNIFLAEFFLCHKVHEALKRRMHLLLVSTKKRIGAYPKRWLWRWECLLEY